MRAATFPKIGREGRGVRIREGLLILLCFLIFAEGLSWFTASGPSPCLVEQETQTQSHDGVYHRSKSCATFLAGLSVLAKRSVELVGRDDNDKVIVAAFTIVLAISTVGLWLATVGLWSSTNKLYDAGERQLAHLTETAQRELRAYVYVEDATFQLAETGVWKITTRIKNCGHTPAHRVQLTTIVKAVDWNDGNPEIPVVDADYLQSLGTLAPNGDYIDSEDSITTNEATVEEMRSSTKAIFLVGEITYETVFDKNPRVTDFRYLIGGHVGLEGKDMFADHDGNDST
jgi:hypothetical protein